MDGCTHISLLPCAHTEAGDTHRDLSPHCSLQEAPDALPAQLRVTQGSRHPGHSEHRKGEGSGIRGVSTDALLGAVHPRFPRGSPTGRGGAGGCPRASFHPGRPWHGQLGQAWLGPWGRVLLSCLWPLEQWLSPRRQVQAKDKGTWGGVTGLFLKWGQWAAGAMTPSSPGGSSKKPGAPPLLVRRQARPGWPPPRIHPLPAQSPHPPSLSEAAAVPPSPRRLLQGAAPTQPADQLKHSGRQAWEACFPV